MRVRLFIFAVFFIVSPNALAESSELQLELINTGTISIAPGTSTNIAFRLLNNGDEDRSVRLKIDAPAGWNQLSDYSMLEVEKQSAKLKILSFYVTKRMPSGHYNLDITALDKTSNNKLDHLTIEVFVEPRYELIAQVVDAPGYVLAGDSVHVHYLIKNASNAAIHIEASIPKGYSNNAGHFELLPDSLKQIKGSMKTKGQLSYIARNSLSLHLTVDEAPDIKKVIPCIFTVIPSNKEEFDRFERFPVKVSALSVAHQKDSLWDYGVMYDVKGKGAITNRPDRLLSFHVRGPDRKGNPLFGQSDLYSLEYSSPHTTAIAGDNNYRLSYLSESARNGRGAMYEQQLKKLAVGGYINYPRYYPRVRQLYALYGKYNLTDDAGIHAGYLNKTYTGDSTAQVYTVSGNTQLFSWLHFDGEYALGMSEKSTSAYKTALHLQYQSLRGYVDYVKAMKDFPGYMSNSQFISSGLSAMLFKKVSLTMRYHVNNTNLALDTLFANAPQSMNLHFSARYNFHKNHSISIGAYMREREDKMEPKLFHYKARFARLSLSHKFSRLTIRLNGEVGEMDDMLELKEGEISEAINGNAFLSYQFSKSVSLNGFLNYRGGQKYLSDDFKVLYYGGSLKASWPRITFFLRYRNDYTPDEYYKDRSLLAFNSTVQFGKNHEISSGLNYNLRKSTLNSTTLYANFSYSYTLNVPVSKKQNTGSLKGRIYNNGVETVEGIRCTMAGNTVLTDEEGYFEFPVLKKGEYYLLLDYSRAGMYTMAETPGPYKVTIEPGQVNRFEVSLTKSAFIKGNIVILEDENENKQGYIPTSEKLGNLIIEVKSGRQVYRKYTSRNGSFSFDNLMPGHWKVKVYKQGIPQGYELLKSEYEMDLEKGESESIEVNIRKYNRKIKFQNSIN